ncbi:M1 family metallopeptidase [Daejeonella oryzae]|uniref:M1 family metallopeptidase n=1 Tax=Daejeonella oryzae TaxID=1122943 RepID=UPI00041D49E4|nr:M1 family metallopeptidase [Daejeonella oryzae]
MKRILLITSAVFFSTAALAQTDYGQNQFQQLGEVLPTPNNYRTASGAPGHEYWQQKVNYNISVVLDDENQSLSGSETITYINNSPDALPYLWLQVDQNLFSPGSDTYLTETANNRTIGAAMDFKALEVFNREQFQGGYKIKSIKDASGNGLKYSINKTMMRVDLPRPLKSKEKFVFSVDWSYNINNCKTHGGRSGYEYFEADKNYLYEMAQFFPRLAVYNDAAGWQNKQFLGSGEFALEFGDYKVSITVPSDHVVAATGTLQNPNQVMKKTWLDRLSKVKNSASPTIIITQDEAIANEKSKSKSTKTWVYEAENVRDFAWASSRKFIWDAMNVKVGNKDVLAMSLYPKEGNPLWEKFSTQAIAHTLEVYSRYTVNYPYPVAWSINGPVGGMEYPMICFNGPRPETDGTYTAQTKYGLVGVVIHEVGHNFFPMIINSDERQWTWMDEGLNTFCQYLTEQEWEEKYPSRRGEPRDIVNYMSSDKSLLDPIMSNSESVIQLGPNAYAKPATALNILRETVMGRQLFDFAFKQYAERWAFKHPEPADFFRSMEDASAVDLDWFWRGWFYGIKPVDIALNNVSWYSIDSKNPEIEKTRLKSKREKEALSISEQRNKTSIPKYRIETFPELSDFYTKYDALEITDYDRKQYKEYYEALDQKQKDAIKSGINYYILDFENVGGLVMPIVLEMEYEDGTKEMVRIPAEIWRRDNKKVSKLIVSKKPVKQFSLDPLQETADIDLSNNFFPAKTMESKFQLFKEKQQTKQPNLMQQQRDGKL